MGVNPGLRYSRTAGPVACSTGPSAAAGKCPSREDEEVGRRSVPRSPRAEDVAEAIAAQPLARAEIEPESGYGFLERDGWGFVRTVWSLDCRFYIKEEF